MPEVSIIMPNYDCADFIGEAIESILAQTWQDWELIIYDNSTDRSMEVIARYAAQDARIQVYHNAQREGVAIARNKAVRMATGNYVAFLDSDDLWYPQKLEVQMQYVHAQSIDICHSTYDVMTEEGNRIHTVVPPLVTTYEDMLKGERLSTATAVIRRSILRDCPVLPVLEDTAMWLRLLKSGYVAHAILTSLACYRLRRESLSSHKLYMARAFWRLLRDQEKINLPQRIFYFTCYGMTMLKKYAHILPDIFRWR